MLETPYAQPLKPRSATKTLGKTRETSRCLRDRLRLLLERMAGETGGATVNARSPQELEQAFADVVVMLRASYLIGYLPPDGDEREQERYVRVRSRPSYRLVYRDSYWR